MTTRNPEAELEGAVGGQAAPISATRTVKSTPPALALKGVPQAQGKEKRQVLTGPD